MAMTEKKVPPGGEFVEIGELIENGALEWNPSIVEKALQMLDELKSEPRSHYYRALAEYRLSLFHMRKDSGTFRQHVRKGLRALKVSLNAGGRTPDKLALLCLFRDLRSTFSFAGRLDERKALRAITAAKAMSPLDPRAHLAEGIFYFRRLNRNADYAELSFCSLSRSYELYEMEEREGRNTPEDFGWGREEAVVWLALAMKSRGDRAGAFNKLRESLTRSYNHAWAKYEMAVLTGNTQYVGPPK